MIGVMVQPVPGADLAQLTASFDKIPEALLAKAREMVEN